MNLPEQIRTIEEYKELTFSEKKSKFIAEVYSVISENQAKEYLTETQKKYYDASHHCYAYKFANGNFRYADAGEPTGTAGIRILNAIDHFNLMDQMVIVTRYFGGTKLGVGLLGKTYYNAAHYVLDNSIISTKQLFNKVTIISDFENISLVYRILSEHQSIIMKDEYIENIKFYCLIKHSELEVVSKKLSEMSKSKISVNNLNEYIYK
jgi:uncharacterized YigZ family protein